MNGAILSVEIARSLCRNAGRLEAVETSTPTYTNIPNHTHYKLRIT
jgi:hypothetical protein